MAIKKIMVSFLYCQTVAAYTMSVFSQVPTVQDGLSSADMIACAYRAKGESVLGFRVNEETNECEELDVLKMEASSFPSNSEYYKKETYIATFTPLVIFFYHCLIFRDSR